MANNPNVNPNNNSDQLEFNLLGISSNMRGFTVDKKSVEAKLLALAGEALNDGDPQHNVSSVKFVLLKGSDNLTYDEKSKRNSSKPQLSLQVIIPSKNSNLVGKNASNEFIRAEDTTSYSSTFKNFVNAYCNEENKTAYITPQKRVHGVSYRAIVLDIGKTFGHLFDFDGRYYKATKEAEGLTVSIEYTDTKLDIIYDYNSDHRVTDLVGFNVIKKYQSDGISKDISFDIYNTSRRRHKDDGDIPNYRREYK